MDSEDKKEIMLIDEEPVSPAARLLHAPGFNLYIVILMGAKTSVDDFIVDAVKRGLKETLIRHPRFSSILVMKEKKQTWKRTKVNIDDHVIMPDLNPDMESPNEFVEDYASALSTAPMNLTKPLWELHILKVKTNDADATSILRVHHSIGDGVSLISLLLACTRKSSDPKSLPTIPTKKQTQNDNNKLYNGFLICRLFSWFWIMIVILCYTFVDCMMFVATLLFLKDTETPIKGPIYGVEPSPKKFVHRIVSLDDIKLVKNALDVTINDVILGVTQRGLSLYLNRRYEKYNVKGFGNIQKHNHLPGDLRLTAAIVFNNRVQSAIVEDFDGQIEKVSKGTWGNKLGYVMLPFSIGLQEDPLTHIYQAKSVIDRKKLSLESKCTFLASKLILKLFGLKPATGLMSSVFSKTTLTFSNVVGPQEEVTFFGYPISYIAPSVAGIPQALTMHFQSYENKLIICLAVDENMIPDPHQLCDDLVKSLGDMKKAVLHRGLFND